MEEKGELDAADLLDPNPDILGLFCHYNDIYFDSKLHACTVEWSTSRMTLCAGICKYAEGSCAIRLSEPLLKFRPSIDVKETLLHEMIHAYLWLTDNNKDHDDHGPCFQKMMQAINESQAVDHQRPTGGYHLTICHNFSDEVNSYRKHHWKCSLCGDVVKRVNNRAPSQADCYQKIGRGNLCNNERCHWHCHQQLCGGGYEKIAEPEGYKDRRLKARRSGKENAAESKLPSEVRVNKETSTKQKHAIENLEIEKTKNGEDKASCRLPKNASLDMYFSYNSKGDNRGEPVTAPESRDHCWPQEHISSEEEIMEISAKKRTKKYRSDDSSGDDFCSKVARGHAVNESKKEAANIFERVAVQKNECTVIIGWKGWFGFEGEEDAKDIKALKNRRSQRRVFERASSQLVIVGDSVVGADPPGVPKIHGLVSFSRELVESRDDKAVDENVLCPPASCVSDSFVTLVVSANGSAATQLMPADLCSVSHAETVNAAELGHHEGATLKELQVGDSTMGHEASSIAVALCQEAQASFCPEQTALMDCATVVPANKESLSLTLNRDDLAMVEAHAEGPAEVEDLLLRTGKVAGVGEVKTLSKGRSKRSRDNYGRSDAALPTREPSAVCPICEMIFVGNIEDANFNAKLNEHIDACMSKL